LGALSTKSSSIAKNQAAGGLLGTTIGLMYSASNLNYRQKSGCWWIAYDNNWFDVLS
jgi:hypothetical protein